MVKPFIYIAAIGCILAFLLAKRMIRPQRRLQIGMPLLVAGWAGLITSRWLPDSGFTLVAAESASIVGIVVALAFLVSAFFDWLGPTRPKHQQRRFPPFKL